jgi:hypothetical protein
MVLTCSKCSRANPTEAVYCYFDGFVLGGAGRGPLSVGAQPFASPFVFSSGRVCRSFDELAIACQEEWNAATDMLKRGFLEAFFGGLGRMDLVAAAKDAAKFPDKNRGLDQLLSKLPSNVLAEAALKVTPVEMNLGVIPPNTDRKFELHLENAGMRIVYGSANSSEGWLVLGDGDGASEKHFQFHHEQMIPVRVRMERLRAGNKPQEAQLLVQSNAGVCEVVVRAERPVMPFAHGALAGARSPRQIAEKAKVSPKEAATLFENGAVAHWYKDNGWTYPVQGPSASGVAAVQQFFEALGLTAPPKVHISEKRVAFEGSPGQAIDYSLQISSEEKRPVFAHGISDQPWLEVGRAKYNGRIAVLPLTVPAVPNRPGEVLKARITVQSNGNQRFVVPVALAVGGQFDFSSLTLDTPAPPPLPTVPVVPVEPLPTSSSPAPPPPPPPTPPNFVPAPPTMVMEAPPTVVRTSPRRRHLRQPLGMHLAPAVLLVIVLLGLMVYDFFRKPQTVEGAPELQYDVVDRDPLLNFSSGDNYRFGLVLLKEKDPANPDQHKRLTYRENGATNNTCLKIDGQESLYGVSRGRRGALSKLDRTRHSWTTQWYYPEEKILVTQGIQIVPGAQSGKLDTCLVRYTIENKDSLDHKVGLRVMFDTYIGGNDGVPFMLSNRKGVITTPQVLEEKEVPDYIQALERPDPANPGTVAYMGLVGVQVPNVTLEPIHKLILRKFPGSETRWDETIPDEEKNVTISDSCILLFWDYRTMNPGEKRSMAFTYGLNAITAPEGGGNLSLTAGGSFVVGGNFTISAIVKAPIEGEKVTLGEVPAGLTLATGQEHEQTVQAKGDYTQVSWRVHSDKVGDYLLKVSSSRGSRIGLKVNISKSGLFH